MATICSPRLEYEPRRLVRLNGRGRDRPRAPVGKPWRRLQSALAAVARQIFRDTWLQSLPASSMLVALTARVSQRPLGRVKQHIGHISRGPPSSSIKHHSRNCCARIRDAHYGRPLLSSSLGRWHELEANCVREDGARQQCLVLCRLAAFQVRGMTGEAGQASTSPSTVRRTSHVVRATISGRLSTDRPGANHVGPMTTVMAACASISKPIPMAITPTARATCSPSGARRSAVMAAVTTTITRTSMTPAASSTAVAPAQLYTQCSPWRTPYRVAAATLAGNRAPADATHDVPPVFRVDLPQQHAR
jgi:hypothetical protein